MKREHSIDSRNDYFQQFTAVARKVNIFVLQFLGRGGRPPNAEYIERRVFMGNGTVW